MGDQGPQLIAGERQLACRLLGQPVLGQGIRRQLGDGHQEIELALVRLYESTGNRKYLDLSSYFLEVRGQNPHFFAEQLEENDRLGLQQGPKPVINTVYHQAHKPVIEQDSARGHAVRLVYMAQAMASGVIPQITAVFGTCGGGMALIPAMTDFTFMESKNGKLFVNSPNALDGNHVSKCDTASADFQGEEAGLVDFAGTEEEILGQIRNLVSMLPANNEDEAYTECEDDLNRACADLANCAGDTGILLSQLSDNGIYFETKAAYGKDVVTAFIQLNGATVGAVANRSEIYGEDGTVKEKMDGTLSARGAKKAADFVNFCDAFCIPVLTITNVTGFKATKCSERTMAKNAAALTAAFANATVPKVNVVVGKAYGSAYVVMNSKSIGADMVFAWPNAEIGMMDAKSAAKIMYEGSDAATINEKAAEYATLQNNVTSAARRGYVDLIVDPADTRKYLVDAFELLYTKCAYTPDKKHGTK